MFSDTTAGLADVHRMQQMSLEKVHVNLSHLGGLLGSLDGSEGGGISGTGVMSHAGESNWRGGWFG